MCIRPRTMTITPVRRAFNEFQLYDGPRLQTDAQRIDGEIDIQKFERRLLLSLQIQR